MGPAHGHDLTPSAQAHRPCRICARKSQKGPAVTCGALIGGAKRSRTADLLNAIQALYQLSYSPEPNNPSPERRRSSEPGLH